MDSIRNASGEAPASGAQPNDQPNDQIGRPGGDSFAGTVSAHELESALRSALMPNLPGAEPSPPESIVSPGRVVKDIMASTFVSDEQAARRLGLTLEELHSFYEGELPLTQPLAFKLKEATGFTASHWEGMEKFYRRRMKKWRESLDGKQ